MTDIDYLADLDDEDREHIEEALRRKTAIEQGRATTVRAVLPVGSELRRSRDARHGDGVYLLRGETDLKVGEEIIVMASGINPASAATALRVIRRLPVIESVKNFLARFTEHDVERYGTFPDAVVLEQFDASTWLIEVITPERPLHVIRDDIDTFTI